MVIVLNNKNEALRLSKKLKVHRRGDDKEYSLPVMSSDGKRWAIQVLDVDIKKLDKIDMVLLEELPEDFYSQIY